MSIDHDFPRSSIDRSTLARAMESGALDDGVFSPGENDSDGPEAARLNCRLTEILFHEGRQAEALEYGRRAFALAGDDENVAHCCAWLFSNCGLHAEAAEAYRRLLDRHPDWVEGYRHLSGSLAACGDHEAAIVNAVQASERVPGNFDFALHAGCLLLDVQRPDEAMLFLGRALGIEPQDPRVLRALSVAEYALDRPRDAVEFALRAAALAPSDSNFAVHASELLLRADRAEDALVLLGNAARREPHNPMLWRLISAAEGQRGDADRAIAAIERALEHLPGNAEYHLHHGHLLYALGEFAAAAEAFNRAAEIDPANHAVWRAQVDVLLAEGRITDATALGGARQHLLRGNARAPCIRRLSRNRFRYLFNR